MKFFSFLGSVSLGAIGATLIATPVWAQQTPASDGTSAKPSSADSSTGAVQEIVITGIRKSVTDSANIKRNAIGVVDAITAEDIGKFPDTNLAESLQRISGVSIDRSNNEGNQVTVRGFGPQFNLVTLDGRQMPNSSALQSAGVNRSFNFDQLSSEGVSAVEVYKTGRADMSSGGIGATINVKTPKPFDYDGFTAVASAKGNYDTSVKKGARITPDLAGMVSDTFLDGAVGILINGSYSVRNSHKDRVGTQGWVRNRGNPANIDRSAIDTSLNPTQAWWVPWTVDVDHWDTHRTRTNLDAVLQVKPFDNLTVTGDYVMSRYKENTQMNRMSYWFDTPTGKTDSNGTMTQINSAKDQLNFWAWDYSFYTKNDSLGINLKWDATHNLSFTLDAHNSTSKSQPNGQPSETLADLKNTPGTVGIGANFDNGIIPAVTYDDSALPGGAYNPANIVSDLYQQRGYQMNNKIKEVQFAGKWDNGGEGALSSIKFGADYTDYEVNTNLYSTFLFVNVPLNNLNLTFVPTGNTANKFSGTDKLFPYIPVYSANDFVNLVKNQNDFVANPPRANGVSEKTYAGYLSFDFKTDFNGMPVNLNAGVRYEKTDVSAYSVQQGVLSLNYRNPQELAPVYDGVFARQSLGGGYSRFLPNIDFRMNPFRNFVVRAAYSKTIARSSLSAMFPSENFVNSRPGGPFTASLGNPNLQPYESDNIDLSLEWYYKPGSYVSVGVFKKWVKNFIGADATTGTILDVNGNPLRDPSVNPRPGCPDGSITPNPACLSQPSDPIINWQINTVGNLKSASIQGVEATVQQLFGDTGFGAILNGTLVGGDLGLDPFNFSQTLALTGLSDSANAIVFYEKHGFQARVAYNWRNKFLLSLGAEPTYVAAYGQVDASASYDVTPRFTIVADGLNLTNSTVHRYGRFSNQLIDAEQYGPRFSFGFRVKF